MTDVNLGKQDALDWDELYNLIDYNSKTGIFTAKVSRGRIKVGDILGGNKERKGGYLEISINRKTYLAHRLAWFYEYSKWPLGMLDHKDQIRHNNWISNLREATNSQNQQNIPSYSGTSSKYKGVCLSKTTNKWQADIKIDRKSKYLGQFSLEVDAAKAYNKAATKYFGEFASLNEV